VVHDHVVYRDLDDDDGIVGTRVIYRDADDFDNDDGDRVIHRRYVTYPQTTSAYYRTVPATYSTVRMVY
jgi:hypothetical protein